MILEMGSVLSRLLRIPLTILTAQNESHRGQLILDQARRELEARDTEASYATRPGRTVAEITAAATLDTLLVMGASGRSRFYHTVLGDVTQQVTRGEKGLVLLSAKPVAQAACERSAA